MNGTSSSLLDPYAPIRAIFDMVGAEARCEILAETVKAWVDQLPDEQLLRQYGRAVSDLTDEQIADVQETHMDLAGEQVGSDSVALQVRFADMTCADQRHALTIAARLRIETAFDADADAAADKAFDCVLAGLPDERLGELRRFCESIYCSDRLGVYTHN